MIRTTHLHHHSASRRSLLLRSAALLAAATVLPAHAADSYPARPVRIVVPVAPGGGTDTIARLFAEELRGKLGQPVIIDNRAGGAGGLVGADHVAHSAPDGYTLLVAAGGPLATHKFLYPKLGFDPAEFVPISLLAEGPNVLLVRPDLPIRSVSELIAYAKARPGKINYATGGAGTSPHLAMELLKNMAGLDMQHVAYKGAAAALSGMLGKQSEVQFIEMSTALPQIKAGTVRAIAVGTIKRTASLPDVPAMSETLPGFQSTVWFGLVAPPETPADIARKLSAAMAEVLKEPRIIAKLQALNYRPMEGTAADMAKFLQQESERWGKVIRDAKIVLN